ncbi:efflux RND transporter permease subunit [Aliiruegeria sabulilitoris]|uniref:efflux RND transporter permease subunit n=1 Tax=Aliiruegeria sabulilitoris TaxID=1510458 RepID=UPI000831A31F|nr:efflux RND transporter permease subunit [Aliiruegeria sabulilitoris]NDR54952.1 efflux RND transporter permease subunit [Pseudoruegeria sp. M32A2M]
MRGIVDWASHHTRMAVGIILLALVTGAQTYINLPKEGEPDIEIPAVFISVPFPGISAADAEKLLVKPMETEMADLDGLDRMTGTAVEGYANLVMEFDFGWDKSATLADVRAAMTKAESNFPDGAENYTVEEFNFSEFPIIIVNLTGRLPERTLLRIANDLQSKLEGLEPILEAALTGHRDEMVEVIIDPLKLEAYNVTASELIQAVVNNNQLIAAGEIEADAGAFAVKIPSSFDTTSDIYGLPVKVNGDSVVTLGDLATISLTFEDRVGTARFDGEKTVALQVVKRKGYNIIDTAALVRETVQLERAKWPPELQDAIVVGTSNDQSVQVESMVRQLEGSVLTAILLVMIVVLAALGPRPSLLVGFSIPTSFLLCFGFLAAMDVTISNMVMFGLILSVGMLVDGAIVVVEYADKRIQQGTGPMHAYVEAAKRMFWPIVSSTATTLCAFLPMLFWPGVSGEFMKMLPITLIFVLSASLVVALVFLPVVGGITGRLARSFHHLAEALRRWPWILRAALVAPSMYLIFVGAMQVLNPGYFLSPDMSATMARLAGVGILFFGAFATSITADAAKPQWRRKRVKAGYQRTAFGYFIKFLTANPIMPLVTVGAVAFFIVSTFTYFGDNNNGTEFFVENEPEQSIIYVRARGNLSLGEKDAIVAQVEQIALQEPGVDSVFAFAGEGGLNANTGGASSPRDTIGQIQIELIRWENRKDNPELDGDLVLERLRTKLDQIPGIYVEVLDLAMGPGAGKPIHLRLTGDDWEPLTEAALAARTKFEEMPGLFDIEDTLPLPGIDWQIDVDVEKAGRYGANVATVGGMVQLITRGILLDTMRVDSSDEEIDIRVRLPEQDRLLTTLDSLKVRTPDGLIPLSNFITRQPVPKLSRIDRVDSQRYFDVKADVTSGLVKLVNTDGEIVEIMPATTAQTNAAMRISEQGLTVAPITATERITLLTEWMENEQPFGPDIGWQWTGDEEEQQESQEFLSKAFGAALGLMFIILLTQFNSIYNSVLVLLAVVLSTSGVLIGMLVMDQTFSIIMTGTGIVALAGIVVNNNIVLIDTYQEFSQYMPRIEAIIRTAEQRLRPVLLTTSTTIAGLTPMMLGISLDFFNGGYTLDSPTALWWKQLATAVVFGLGTATVLTLIVTPALLALRVWFWDGAYRSVATLRALSFGRSSRAARDARLTRTARRVHSPELIWLPEDPGAEDSAPPAPTPATEPDRAENAPEQTDGEASPAGKPPLRAAE